MCGIVAIVSWKEAVEADLLDRALLSLRHRGPDAQNVWFAPHRHAALGHARLSIIDLLTGSQPIANQDGSIHLVVNGEFYDHERIRSELAQRGHWFATGTDSEIALHLYEEHGAACLEHLRGEFAFALWDERDRTFFAVRDRFGIKPLFYFEANGVLLVASEVKAFAAAGVRLQWDRESVFQNLFACVAQDRTLFAGVKQVPPGHFLVARRDFVRVARYWDVNYPAQDSIAGKRSESEWIEQLREHAEEAVRLRLRADVPVGCLLSGGLDSSATLGMARKFFGKPLAAFTIAFDHPDYDESATACETARRASAEFHPIRVTHSDLAAHFADAVWHSESLHYNAHGTARYLLSRAVRDAGYKVVLAGEGGDELAAGYHFCKTALESPRSNPPSSWTRALLRMWKPKTHSEILIAGTSPWLVRVSRWLGFPSSALDYVGDKICLMRGLLGRDFAAEFARQDPYRQFFRQFDVRTQLWGREPVKQLLYLWMKSFFVNYVLAGERLDMAHAVELRLPFLDHHLFQFARQIPASLFVRDGQQKFVLREAMKPFVADEVYAGKKQPFIAPPLTLQADSVFTALAQDTLRSKAVERVPFFDRSAVLALLDRVPLLSLPERSAFDPVLLMMLSVCVLHQRYRL